MYNQLETFLQCIKLLGLAGGKHQKTWKQEIRREHDSNPFYNVIHVYIFCFSLVVFLCNFWVIFPAILLARTLLVGDVQFPTYCMYMHLGDNLWDVIIIMIVHFVLLSELCIECMV